MDYVEKAQRYIRNVLNEKIPACQFVKLACQRQLDDLKKKKTKNFHFILIKNRQTGRVSSLKICVM